MTEENGVAPVDMKKFQKISWPAGYKMGDASEESKNLPGKGATLAAEYKAKAMVKGVQLS